jgi:hypothetical protein
MNPVRQYIWDGEVWRVDVSGTAAVTSVSPSDTTYPATNFYPED